MNNPDLFKKYLKLIGVEADTTSYQFLCRIVKANLLKIPFENISKLLIKKQERHNLPSFAEFLYGVEKYNFGGTCYANNYYLYLLLEHLGFDVKLCGADMKKPDVHLISIVNIDGKEYIVDAGYAAPFLKPLPRDLKTNFVINRGNEKYIVKTKDKKGNTEVEQYFNNELQHWYRAKPQPRKIEQFRDVIEDSYADDATFMNAIRAVRFTENGSVSLKNYMLTETNGANDINTKLMREEIPAIVKEKFGIPEKLVEEAMGNIKEIKDIYD